jgi:hypothetical protein
LFDSLSQGGIVHHVDSSDLSSCTVRILDPHSQSYLPVAHIKDRLGKSLKQVIEHPVQLVEDQFINTHSSSSAASQQVLPLVEDSTISLLRRLRSLQVEAGHSFVEASVSAQVEGQVQFAGMLKGLISPIMSPMMKVSHSVCRLYLGHLGKINISVYICIIHVLYVLINYRLYHFVFPLFVFYIFFPIFLVYWYSCC